jgi:hypothetical protein
MNVYLWSLPPVSAPPSYHKILGAVKTETTTATSWGWGRIYGIVEMTKGKLLYCPAGILHNNDVTPSMSRHRQGIAAHASILHERGLDVFGLPPSVAETLLTFIAVVVEARPAWREHPSARSGPRIAVPGTRYHRTVCMFPWFEHRRTTRPQSSRCPGDRKRGRPWREPRVAWRGPDSQTRR